jgi:hypothetical protein
MNDKLPEFYYLFEMKCLSKKKCFVMTNYLKRKSWFKKSVQENIFKEENMNLKII